MAPVLSKLLVFVDDGERIEFPAGTPCEVIRPEAELAGDPHRLGLVLGALEDRQRRFRPGVVVLLGGRARVLPVRLIEGGTQ